MTAAKITAGAPFPPVSVMSAAGAPVDLRATRDGTDWKMVVVYRGRHCPMCTKYLNELETHYEPLAAIGVDLVAVSADSKAQLDAHRPDLKVSFPLAYGLTIAQMQALGLYISEPRSPQETDHPFAEPGLFVINAEGNVHVADISNNPFVRPEQATLVSGLKWIRDPENNYPVRGTWS